MAKPKEKAERRDVIKQIDIKKIQLWMWGLIR